jgi:alpha/beta hydrolase fold
MNIKPLLILVKKILLWAIGGLATLIGIGFLYQFIATKLDNYAYPAPGKLIDIGICKLHIHETGSGEPTVILDAGTGCNSLSWALVQPEIAKFTRVCSYDRAGYGWSEESSTDRTSSNIVDELHLLLKNADIPGPYILVGHSFGGLNARLYASRYPKEVVGVILVDSGHENQSQLLPPMPERKWLPTMFLFVVYSGLIRHLQGMQKGLDLFPENIKKMLLAKMYTIKQVKTTLKEGAKIEESCAQLKKAGGVLDNKPLIVISAGKKELTSESGMSQEWVDQFNQAWVSIQADLVTKSIHGKQMIAERSGHMIPFEQPKIIVDAVRDMVAAVRKR